MDTNFKMSRNRLVYQIIILVILYGLKVKAMSVITQNLLTPMKEEGEACGYESCPIIKYDAINVHIVPSTHGELGYTRTFDSHFTGRDDFYDTSNINMKRILDFVITELWKEPKRKFTFTDLPYLFQWWKIRDATVHRMVYQLIRQGRLHFAGGGWSMTDESCNNYHAIIDHYTYSLRKLNNTFLDCARPYVSWQADSFGHTSEFASLISQMGFDGHFINPISYDDELARMQSKRLEYVWRGSPDLGSSSDIFTHKLFDGYWAPPGFCFGGQCSDPLIVLTDSVMSNVEQRVKLFIEAMKYRQAPHYATNHIMIVMGQRLGYYDAKMWFDNIDKLLRGLSKFSEKFGRPIMPFYSTPICYLKAVYESNITLDVETGDHVPVAYDKKTHFAGLFTSRPSVKYAIRIGHHYLQISKQLQVLGQLKEYSSFFEDFHWIVGVMGDHNILSGAMRPNVRDYYIDKLYKSVRSSEHIIKDGISHLLKSPSHIHYSRCLFNISYCEHTDKDNYHIVIYNPLSWPVKVPVRLPIQTNSQYTVYGPNSVEIKSVVMRIPASIKRIHPKGGQKLNYELIFIAENVPPLGLNTYYIEKVNRKKRSVKMFAKDKRYDSEMKKDMIDIIESIKESKPLSESSKDTDILKKDILLEIELKKNELLNENEKEIDKVAENIYATANSKDISSKSKENTANIFKKDTTTLSDKEKIDNLVNKYKAFLNEFNILKDIFNELRNDLISYKKGNATANMLKKDKIMVIQKSNRIKRDYEEAEEPDRLLRMFRSLLRKHKNAQKSDEMSNMARNLKKLLNYNFRVNLLEREINRRLQDVKIPLKRDSREDKNDANITDLKINQDSKEYSKDRRNTFTRVKRNDNCNYIKRDEKSGQEVTTEKNDKIKYYLKKRIDVTSHDTYKKERNTYCPCKKTKNNRHFFKKLRIKRKTEIGEKEINLHPDDDVVYLPTKIHDVQTTIIPENSYEIEDIIMHNKTYDWVDIDTKDTTYNDREEFMKKNRIKLKKKKTHTNQDKTYTAKDIDKIYDNGAIPNDTSEEVVLTDKFEFILHQNSSLKLKLPINSTNHKNQTEFNTQMTEPTRISTNTARTARRSLIKKIKSAQKKYLRRQTNNLKIDDESLLRNNNYDDEDEEGVEYDGDDKNMTEYDEEKVKVVSVPIVTTVRTTTKVTTDTTTRRTTTESPSTTKSSRDLMRSNDDFIGNEYIHISLSPSRRIFRVRLSNGVTMALSINFYYYASDDPLKLGRPHDKKPGAFVFSPMDNEPVLIEERTKVEVLKSDLVQELHVTGSLISYIVRVYKETPYFELTWVCGEIPVGDGVGKDVFVRYQTDLDTGGVFYTDSNGRQTMKRVFGHKDNFIPSDPTSIPGNYYPVTSKITIEDAQKLVRFSVFNDRTQGASSNNGQIDLMLNRRILTDDAGIQAFLNETETISGKHYFYLTKLNSKINRIFEKKLEKEIGLSPQIFVPNKVLSKSNWDGLKKQFRGLNKKLPVGLSVLTLQLWNDRKLLLRIENYLEKSDVVKNGVKKIVLKDLFSLFNVVGVKETTLAGNVWLKDYVPLIWKIKKDDVKNDSSDVYQEVGEDDEIEFRPQQIRTFVITVQYN